MYSGNNNRQTEHKNNVLPTQPSLSVSSSSSSLTPSTLPPNTPNRTLVIILGETRAYKHTFQRFKDNVLNHLSADLALCVADRDIEWKANPFYANAKYTWLFPDVDDWSEAYEFAARTVYYDHQYKVPNSTHWKTILSVGDQFMGGVKGKGAHKGSAGILLFMRWWLQQQLKSVIDQYDWFIVTRSDYYYLHPHPNYIFNDTSGTIWIVEGEDWGGVTDRHAVLPRIHVNTWLEFVDSLMKDTNKIVRQMRGKTWNLEAVLKWRLQEQDVWKLVKRFRQVMFTVRDKDTRTRWSTGTYNPQLGLFVKYPDEYNRAKKY